MEIEMKNVTAFGVALGLALSATIAAQSAHSQPTAQHGNHQFSRTQEEAITARFWRENEEKVIGPYSMADLTENPLHTEQRFLAAPLPALRASLAVNTVPIPLRSSDSALSEVTMIRAGFYVRVANVYTNGFAKVEFPAGDSVKSGFNVGYIAAGALRNIAPPAWMAPK